MAQLAVIPQPERIPKLYYHRQLEALQCLHCEEYIEIPNRAILTVDGIMQLVKVREDPENLVLFRELHTLDHERCHTFKDLARAKDYREHRKAEKRRQKRGVIPICRY